MLSVHNNVGINWTRDHSLRNKNFINELECYYSLLTSNYGPNSCLSLIDNSAGGNFLTSSSQTLVKQVSFNHPCFKFINALITSQNKCYGAHGLFVGILCTGLLLRGLKSEEKLSHQVLREVSEWIQFSLLKKLEQNYRNISGKLNIGKLSEMLCVVRAVVKSKSFYCLSEEECEHVSIKIIEAFLATLPDATHHDFGEVDIRDMEGLSSRDSHILNGLLYRVSDGCADDLRQQIDALAEGPLKIVVFTVPLSHEVSHKGIIEWHSMAPINNSFSTAVRKELSALLTEKGIKVIACQMYIEEDVKYLLRKKGFLLLERLGTSLTESLVKVAGCSPVTSLGDLHSRIDRHVGSIPAIQMKIIAENSYLLIPSRETHPHVTFVLTAENIYTLAFLKECVETGISLLRELIKNPRIVSGGGCFDLFVVQLLTKIKVENILSLSQALNTSNANVKMIFDGYIDTFLSLAMMPFGGKYGKLFDFYVDDEVFHLWKTSPKLQEETSGKDDDIYRNEHLRMELQCACRCVSKRDLSSRVRFSTLFNIKYSEQEKEAFSCHFDLSNLICDEERPPFILNPQSIVDSFSAKQNAIRFAFDGFSDLFRLGLCIYE